MPQHDPERRWKIARGFPRFALTVKVTITQQDNLQRIAGKTVDIGLGGFCAAFPEPLSEKKVLAEFRVPLSRESLTLKAVLRHNEGDRYGFQFLNITPEEREAIRRGCQTLPKT